MADGEARTGEAETQLAMAREKLAWAEAQSGAQLAQKEQEWEARMDTATSGAHQEVGAVGDGGGVMCRLCSSTVAMSRQCLLIKRDGLLLV